MIDGAGEGSIELRDLAGSCDGIHDEGAPAQYLCTRCFPDLIDRALVGDLQEPRDDDYDEIRRDESQETE